MPQLTQPSPSQSSAPISGARAPARAHRQQLPWPDALLTQFSLRMASHGMSISSVDMRGDARYALQQLAHARDMGDAGLALIADELFRCFRAHQSGLSLAAH
jgi:hypothetical protein